MSSQNSGENKEPVKVYKWDGTAVKNALDDAVKVMGIPKKHLIFVKESVNQNRASEFINNSF